MGCFEISDRAAFDIAIIDAGNAAVGMWVRAGSWVAQYGTDIPTAALRIMGTRKDIDRLVSAGLIAPAGPDAWRLTESPLGRVVREQNRARISPEVRQAVFARDRFRCIDCGSADDLTLDHVHPWSLGGSDKPENLQTLCRPCNSKKGARIDPEVT
jgi:hypothetical protein